MPRNPRQPYRVWCSDETGRLCLTYFNGREDYLKKLLPPGERRVVSGKVEIYQGEVQMTHPDHVVPLDERDSILRVEPVYGLTGGLTQRPLQKAIAAAVERAPELAEWQDAAWLKRQKWSDWKSSLAHGACAGRRSRPLAGASGPRAARLRRAAGKPARHRAGAPSPAHAGRPRDQGRRPPAEARAGGAALHSSRRARSSPRPRSPPTWPRPSAWCGCCRAMSAAARRWSPSSPC